MTTEHHQLSHTSHKTERIGVKGLGMCLVSGRSQHLQHSVSFTLSVGNGTCGCLLYFFLLSLGQSPFIKNTLYLHLPATLTLCFFSPLWQTLLAGPGATQGHTSTAMLHLPVLRHMITGGCPKGVHRGGKHANWGWHEGRELHEAEQGAKVKGNVSKWLS